MGRSSLFVLCWALLASAFCQSVLTFQETRVGNITTINTVGDLSRIEPGHVFPRHGLLLLYYLAQDMRIDQNDVVTINLRPDRGDAGFREYEDQQGLFPSLADQNERIYSLGNMTLTRARELGKGITWNYNQQPTDVESNRDRLLISYRDSNRTVGVIYVTQRYPARYHSNYDIDNAHQITRELLREIQGLSLDVFLYKAGYMASSYSRSCRMVHHGTTNQMNSAVHQCGQINLEVKTTGRGYAQIKWYNIPLNLLDSSVNVQLYRNGEAVKTVFIGSHSSGTYGTSEYMNKGLQLNLVDSGEVIIRGSVTDDADRKLPVDITGYDAALQMYTIDGWAGARLYIKKTFTDWTNTFYYSWVGFYQNKKNYNDETRFSTPSGSEYYTYLAVIYFTLEDDTNPVYDVYSYKSEMAIHPLAQAQFFLTSSYDSVRAITLPWEA